MPKNPKWKTWLQWYEVNGDSMTIKDQFRLGGHPKAAIRYHLKTGHRE